MKKAILTMAAALLSFAATAQTLTGGIEAAVVDRAGRAPIAGATVELEQDGQALDIITTAQDGKFMFRDLADGNYILSIGADGYTSTRVNVKVEQGLIRNLMFVTLGPAQTLKSSELDASSFSEFDLDDSGYSDAPTILYANNDVYADMVGFGFSAIRFKNRGYASETQDIYLAGVPMNDALTGYTPFSLWSGLNEAMRSKDATLGMESLSYGLGGYNGLTNISGQPYDVRPGWRFSLLSNSALYRLRVMATYASGELDSGWSYAFNASARLGGNDWVEGVYYRSFAFYAGVSKRFGDMHRLSLTAFATPGNRGAQNASTQEVYDLMGDNMYNSNWGYQNGKVRNSRVRKTFEPIITLKYDYTPSEDFSASATLLYRTGYNGYTALDWYDAMDPRPDYYKNLPSYFFMEDDDYNRENFEKAAWAEYAWTHHTPEYANYQHLNWDRLYNVNYANPDGRSKYALEERRVDQNDVNLAGNIDWNIDRHFNLKAGAQFKFNRTENYKRMNDLLGGQYYLNIDSFAERDFASNEALIQNDLDYFLDHNEAEKITRGGKYGYDYLAQIRRANVWANGSYNLGGFTANLAASIGYDSFWRDGLVRKGLFAGLDDNGQPIEYAGRVLTTYDKDGNPVTSKGKSDVAEFLTWSAKLSLAYELAGGHRFSVNAGYFNDAPTFSQAFVSARTRNTMVDGLTTVKTFSSDVNYQYSNNGYNLRVTGFYTKINDQTDVMSFYDDSQHSFTNFAMTGIDQRHMGIELGVQVPLFVEGLSISGVLSWGEYIYTSNPHMVQTVDNSAEIIRDEDVPYWKSQPVYKIAGYIDGAPVYDKDADGNYIIEGEKKHYVPSTPQLAAAIGLNYNINYWFFEVTGQYFAHSYLDMNPLYRTAFACGGGDGVITPEEVNYMAAQEEFDPAFLLNLSIGKSWYIGRKYNIGFSLNVQNILNNKDVKTGGYEQTRLISSYEKDRYYRFDPKYFYMYGANYMLNIYFRF
ncbi:MAG TPA: TonB-dependent receptor [Candidatus Cryptobacteroides intestinipullorum]|nr:TonB-dependent receptor [Candidatus Cryptobacteroides intestinipullorum]